MSEFHNESNGDIFAICDDQLSSSVRLRNVYVSIFCIMVVTAILTNSTVLYVIFARHLWRDVSVIMIGNLAISDIFVCVGVLVPEISKWLGFWEDATYSSLRLCRIHVVSETLFPTVTIFSLVVMSYERCRISRSKLLRNRQPHRLSHSYCTLLAVWVCALVASLPVVKICRKFNESLFYADDWGDFMTKFVFTRFILIYILPLLLITFFYSLMAKTLYTSLLSMDKIGKQVRTNNAGRQAQYRRRRLAVMVFLLVIAFAVGWLPYYLFHFLSYYGNPDTFCTSLVLGHLKNFRLIFFCLLSLLNPCIVYIVGANFRHYLHDAISCKENKTRYGYQTRRTTVTCNPGSHVNIDDDHMICENGEVDV